MKTLQDISLGDIVPSSIRPDSNIYALICAIDPELKLITGDIQQEYILSRIDYLDEEALNFLAWQFHVDFYDIAESIDSKRAQIKDSIKWHMKKGTAWAILKALDMLGVEAEFINWYEDNSKPYTFKIKAVLRHDYHVYSNKDNIAKNISRAVLESKAARSLLSKLDARILDSAQKRINITMAQAQTGNRVLELEEEVVQALLQMFEERIFRRIDEHETFILRELERRDAEINKRLDQITELLRWEETY